MCCGRVSFWAHSTRLREIGGPPTGSGPIFPYHRSDVNADLPPEGDQEHVDFQEMYDDMGDNTRGRLYEHV